MDFDRKEAPSDSAATIASQRRIYNMVMPCDNCKTKPVCAAEQDWPGVFWARNEYSTRLFANCLTILHSSEQWTAALRLLIRGEFMRAEE